MFKQVWLYDGTPVLVESVTKYKTQDGTLLETHPEQVGDLTVEYSEVATFELPENSTEIKPTDGLYEPISFDGKAWVGVGEAEWLAENPQDIAKEESLDERMRQLEDTVIELIMRQGGVN